jgi:hypothetical protein
MRWRPPVAFSAAFGLALSVLVLSSPRNALAQYSDNLADINSQFLGTHFGPGTHAPTPIGDLGKVDLVIDLRGFVPMSFRSKEKDAFTLENMTKVRTALQWYKIPTKKALLMLYFGSLSSDRLGSDTSSLESEAFRGTGFLDEGTAKGESIKWCELAYDIAEKDSDRIFDHLIGGTTFTAAEPTTVFFTPDSAFVIVNFRYSQWNFGDRGQALVALEFSRRLKRYKSLYYLYSTTLFSKSTHEMFASTAPYVARLAVAVFGG